METRRQEDASTTFTHGAFFDAPTGRYLRSREPCGRTTTFLIYDFTKPQTQARR